MDDDGNEWKRLQVAYFLRAPHQVTRCLPAPGRTHTTTLTRSLSASTWLSAGRCRGGPARLGHRRLPGETSEACMNHGSNDGANDRGCHVKPGIAEIARYDHRAQRPHRVESGACKGPTHDDVEGQSHPDRKRREIASAAGDRGAEHHCHQEEGEHRLDHEAG